ncbi:MAG: MYG1 family protein [Chlamydiales bacterium]|nr:MYG1 family protein [Chlamydiales bacterium]
MDNIILNKSMGIHDGTFHADEVTACALLLLFDQIEENKITRTREDEKLAHCEFVCDVGGVFDPAIKRFDHHQETYEGNLSSAGMVLDYLHDNEVISFDLYHYFKQAIIDGVDAIDNGLYEPPLGHCTYSMIISNFMPCTYLAESDAIEKAFYMALHFAIGHLNRLLDRFDYIQTCKAYVEDSMKGNLEYLIFHEAMPWMEAFFALGGIDHPAKYVIMPSRNHWKLRGIPPSLEHRMQVRKPLPKKWAGLLGDELKEVTNIEGAIFCHKGRFISVWETKEAALQALKMALKEKE